jgi:molecular chaperone HtpG
MICESHHLNDLNDRKKYKTSEPYGDSDDETVNLQYCAVLLRTADLLHITMDRTPSITFKVINPIDPISQDEWAKQQAVTRVRPKLGVNQDGQPDENSPKDTIEVSAYFKNEEGFFGLTSYLSYCAEQLKLSHEWVSSSQKAGVAKHEFPWRKIDDTNIQTVGFLRDTFQFAIDQNKILDLLTGHTLYNDSRVVLRELVQNALDAIRLQYYPKSPAGVGKVQINWNTKTRILSVTDNGTGMTQQIISDFLLKVGTSRYQDPDFKKKYPDFSPISRFGIGVLSTFMIADSVEIITCHPDDDQARQLTLRSVHGKYLIRLIDKNDSQIKPLGAHGTSFLLKVRPSVATRDILQAAKMWIVVPGCDVRVTVDDKSPVKVGHESPAHAVLALLEELGLPAELETDTLAPKDSEQNVPVRVIQKEMEGVTLAYAVRWSEYFREWAFVSAQPHRDPERQPLMLGTCIEGIRVEFETPGFATAQIVAIANVTGSSAPKTNVARVGLEATAERDEMLRHVYRIYRDHVAHEVEQLHTLRAYSITWAIEEARYLVADLLQGVPPRSKALLEEELASLKVLAVEKNMQRLAISPKELANEKQFWTIDCTLLHPAEALVREAATTASLSGLVSAMKLPNFEFPSDLVLCGVRPSSTFGTFAYNNREVDLIRIDREQRRIDLRWTNKTSSPRWLSPPPQMIHMLAQSRARNRAGAMLYIGVLGVEVIGESEPALRTFDSLFLLPSTPAAGFLKPWLENLDEPFSTTQLTAAAFNVHVISECFRFNKKLPDAERFVMRTFAEWESHTGLSRHLSDAVKIPELIQFITDISWSVFAPSEWSRQWGNIGSDAGSDFSIYAI